METEAVPIRSGRPLLLLARSFFLDGIFVRLADYQYFNLW